MRILLPVLALVALASCSADTRDGAAATSSDASTVAAARSGGGLTQHETALAVDAADELIDEQQATISSATAIARPGTVLESNTDHPCTSGRVLRLTLIGDFPHLVTTGHPVDPGDPGDPPPDFTVRALVATIDATSGIPCLIGVQTAENGNPEPIAGGTVLPID